MITVKLVGLAHSKLRNSIGAVGVEVDPEQHLVYVKMAKHWDREQINKIAPDLASMYSQYEWQNTIIDISVGEHLVQELKRTATMPIRTIFIKRKLADVIDIRLVKKIDLTEMVQFLLQQKLAHKIKFPSRPSPEVKELEDQIALYAEATTEAGGVNYYAPGEELDDLTKGLMIAVFAARPFLQDNIKIITGPIHPRKQDPVDQMAAAIDPPPKKPKRRRIRGI